MQFSSEIVEAIGNTPLIRLKRVLGSDRLRNSGQGGIPQSRPVGQGSRRLVHHPGCGDEAASSSPAAPSSKAPPATPASGWRWSPMRMGFRTVIVIPDTQSQEKKDTLRLWAPS